MPTIQTPSDDELVLTSWGQDVAVEVNTNCIKRQGGTMIAPLNLPTANPTAATHAAHKAYVDTKLAANASGTLTGTLTINPSGDLCLQLRGTNPYLRFLNEAGTIQYGYFQGRADGLYLFAEDAGDFIRFYINEVLAGEFRSDGELYVASKVITSISQASRLVASNAAGNQIYVVDPNRD